MSEPYLADCHTHTSFSFDCDASPDRMVSTALRKGVQVYAITDHSDHCSTAQTDYQKEGVLQKNWEHDITKSFQYVERMKKGYQNQPIKLLNGIELGEPLQAPEIANQIVKIPFDFVIGSLHNVKGERDFYHLEISDQPLIQTSSLLSKYFQQLYTMVQWGKFDTLAHLTYPIRYFTQRKMPFDFALYQDDIDQIFASMIQKEIALELNTSGLVKAETDRSIEEWCIKRYRELGGKFLTIGSDAHEPDHIGRGIPEGLKLAKEAGFSHITYYEQRTPVLMKIKGY